MKGRNRILILFFLSVYCFAQDQQENKGFTPPGTPFGSNPFNAKPNENLEDDFDLDDEGDVDAINEELMRQKLEQRLHDEAHSLQGDANGRQKNKKAIDFGEASSDIGATSTSGGANSKIIPANRGPNCLNLDPYAGTGSDIITNFDFPDAEVIEIAKTLGKLTCLNFLFDKDVRGKISVVSNSAITIGDAWKAFLTALDVNGFSLIPSGKYFRIARQRDAKDKQIKTYTGDFAPNNDMYITKVLPLKYINAEEVSRVFRNFMPPNTRIIAYDQTNTLIITDTGSNINKIVDMVKLLDVEGFDERLEVIHIQYASAQDIAKLIDQLLPGSNSAQPSPAAGISRFRSQFLARKTKEGGVISHIIPDDRTNSVIVSANGKGLDQVKELIEKLDAKVNPSTGGSKIHVVYLQFADAEQVAQTLNNLASGGNNLPTKPITSGSSSPNTTAQLFEGSIKISADKPTNSLVITGTPTDYLTIKQVLSRLDVPRDQVYVEAIIMEMTLDKSLTVGTNVVLPNQGVGFSPSPSDFSTFLTNPLGLSGLALGFKSGRDGKTFSIPGSSSSVSVDSVQGLIQALQQNTNANVLSTPQILTLDNQQATIEVAENIPILTTTAVQGAGTQQSITREKVALTLTIKPQINKISNFVKLDIKQKIEDISNKTVPKGVSDQAFATTSRSSETTVVVQDSDTVALGGLVRDKVAETQIKIPLLGDIPILGWLFRSTSRSTTKQNLIAFITPKIIKQYRNIRKIVDKKIRERDEFIDQHSGGEDPFLSYKEKMIKSLPNENDLKDTGHVENLESDIMDESPSEEVHPNSTSIKQPQALPSTVQKTTTPVPTPNPVVDGATAPGVPQEMKKSAPQGAAQ